MAACSHSSPERTGNSHDLLIRVGLHSRRTIPSRDYSVVLTSSTPHIVARGHDGGTDILAYPDTLDAKTPHVRVQVKHRQSQKASREEIQVLRGIIRQDRENGLFVSSGGFTPQTRSALPGKTESQASEALRG